MIFRCDCGNECYQEPGPRSVLRSACKRCLDLDGHTEAEGRFIEHLRDLGGFVTSQALADDAGASKEYTLRVLRRLIDRGRVVRIRLDRDKALFCLVDGKRKSTPLQRCFGQSARRAKRSTIA